jgi:hypothetical protein
MVIEKRRFSRVRENRKSVLYPAGEHSACSLKDISYGGLCFESAKDIINGLDLKGELKFSSPRLKSALTIPAGVKPVWSKKIGKRFEVGAEFTDISDQDRDFILKRVERASQRQNTLVHIRQMLLHSLLFIAVIGGAALFIFQQKTFESIQNTLQTALSYSDKALDSAAKEKQVLQKELNDTKVFLAGAEGLLKSDRIKSRGEISRLKKDIGLLKNEVARLSDINMKMDARLHDPKELRLAIRDVKRDIYLKKVSIQKRLDEIKSLNGNKGYIIKNSKVTSGTKGVTVNVLPAETRGLKNWE